MSIVDNIHQRRFWSIRLHQVHNRISDLRSELDIALQQPVTVAVMQVLAEVDVDLSSAQATLALADTKINQLERTS